MSPVGTVATIMAVVFAVGIGVGALLVIGIAWIRYLRRGISPPGPPPPLPPGGPDDFGAGPPTQPIEPDDRDGHPWWVNGR